MPAELAMEDFIAACQRPLRRSLRVNTLKISVADFGAGAGLRLATGAHPRCAEGFWIERDDEELRLGSAAEHLSGLFYIQEASSMLPVSALFSGGAAPNRVLDVAAAQLQNHPNRRVDGQSGRHRRQRILRQPGKSAARQYQPLRREERRADPLRRPGVRRRAAGELRRHSARCPCSGEGVVRRIRTP